MARVKLRLGTVGAFLFISGACALVYQVAWFRELRLVFGGSTAASAAVLAIFMGGLGLGGAWLGRRADRVARPVALYAQLELVVAITAAITPGLVWVARAIYLAVGGHLHGPLSTVVRMLLAVLVLGPSTLAMGGTMPAAARAVERDSAGRQRVAVLYGVNTAGAVLGTVLANFVALEVFGTRLTLWLACLVNILVAVAARMVARSTPALAADAPATAASAGPEKPSPRSWFPPFAATVAGFAFMVMELVWYRMLAPLLGGSSYTFGLILAVALLGIGIGGWLYSRTARASTPALFAFTCALEAVAIAVPFALGDRIAIGALLLRPFARATFAGSVLAWTLVTVPVVLPAAIVSGFQFPAIIGLYGSGSRGIGRDVGRAYLANTLGSIAGSLGGGFGLLPLLSAPHLWQVVVLLLVVTAAVAVLANVERARVFALVTSLVGAVAAVLVLVPRGPTAAWRHSGIGAGRADNWVAVLGRREIDQFVARASATMQWEQDGIESTVELANDAAFAFVVNGKNDGQALMDSGTQVMGGLLPAILHPGATSAFVVGLGTGGTAGYLGAVPTMTRVDVAELEPAILRVARDCAPVNEHVLENPKVHVHLGDARELLMTSAQSYDIVFSEPSNPYRAGISSLYTTEFYDAVAARLNPNGIFVQWMQSYEVDSFTVATAATTLRAVFPKVALWQTMHGDLLFFATREDIVVDGPRVRQRLEQEPWRTAARNAWRTSSLEGVLGHFVATPALVDALVTNELGAVNHDDQNFLEYAFARAVGRHSNAFADVHELSRRLGTTTPAVHGAFDADLVYEERLVDYMAQEQPLETFAAAPSAAVVAFQSALRTFAQANAADALGIWTTLKREPRSYGERGAVAELSALAGAESFPRFAALLENATERDLLTGIWLAVTHDEAGAIDALERGFVSLRTNPWVRRPTVVRALMAATQLGSRPDVAARLTRILLEPFAVESTRDERIKALVRLATTAHDPQLCERAIDHASPLLMDLVFYEARASCYRLAHDPRLAAAEDALGELASYDEKLGARVSTPRRAAPSTSGAPAPPASAPSP